MERLEGTAGRSVDADEVGRVQLAQSGHRVNAWMFYHAPWGVNADVRYAYRSAQPKSITRTDAATPPRRRTVSTRTAR